MAGEKGCLCEVQPCPWVAWRHCATCGGCKKGWCKVRACVAARKPLMLTFVEPEDEGKGECGILLFTRPGGMGSAVLRQLGWVI